jgi:hypothetical protein
VCRGSCDRDAIDSGAAPEIVGQSSQPHSIEIDSDKADIGVAGKAVGFDLDALGSVL